MSRAGTVSLVVHAAVAWLVLSDAPVWLYPPEQRAEIEIVVGDDAARTGRPAPTPDADPEPQSTQPAPAARPPSPLPGETVASAANVTAPPDPDRGAVVQAPWAPTAATAAAAPPGSSAPTSPSPSAAPPAPAAPPVAPPVAQAPPTRVAPPDIRIGDGIAIASAEIEDSGVVHPAQMDFGNVAPEYPPEAARRREQGTVTLRVFIATDGHVERVAVARSSGSTLLDHAALERVATWHFTPARRNGRPVADVEEQSIRFVPE